ncbi:MAG: ABC transporter permease subunit, partial [Planctomycetota bacterium]
AAAGLALAPLTARRGGRGPLGRLASRGARLACVLLRAVPEYVLAFLLGALVPSPAWACVLALAVHNGGILGRLYGETVENLDPRPARAWRGLGARPSVTFALAEVPTALPRLLTYFFYRFETCVRESTVLGMLGFVSLGHWIVQERAAGRYDEVLVLVGLGAAIVLAADLVSWALRTLVRRAT